MTQLRKVAAVLRTQPTPASNPAPARADDEWLDVKALFRIIRRQIPIAILVFVAVMALATIPILDMKRSFTAQATVLMRDPPSSGLLSSDPSAQKPLNLSTEIERILSRDISVQVIREVGLDKLPEFNAALSEPSALHQALSSIKQMLFGVQDTLLPEPELEDLRLVIPAYMARLAVFQQGNSDVVHIGFSSEDATIAATVTNTVIRTYLQARERQYRSEIDTYVEWLSKRIEKQKNTLEAAFDAVVLRRDQPDLSSPSAVGVDAAIASLTERRIATRLALATAQRALEDMRSDGSAVLEDGDTRAERGPSLGLELQIAKAELAQVLQDFGQNHSKVKEVRRRISDIEARLQFSMSSRMRRLENQIDTLQAEERTTFQELEQARETLANGKNAEIDLAQLARQVDQEQSLLASLEQEQRAIVSSAGRRSTEVSVLMPASVPLFADGRGKSFYLVVAMIGAALAAITTVFGLEILDTSVRSGEHLRRIQRVSSAGILPALSRRRSSGRGAAGWWRKDDVFVDAMRGVTIFMGRAFRGQMPNSILVSSALPREGKTTVAAALAAELAASGRHVLLVDADMRHGDLHTLFGQAEGPGLSDYLSGTHKLAEVVRSRVSPSIDLLGCGTGSSGARLDQQKIAALLLMALDAGQIVVIDTPPALASVDTASLSDLVEAQMLVVEWGRTEPDAVEAAVQRMAPGDERDIFVVINRVNLRRQALYGFRDAGPLARTLRTFHRKKRPYANAVRRGA